MADVELNFLAKQIERITADIGMLRDDLNVLRNGAAIRRHRDCIAAGDSRNEGGE